MNTSIYTNTVWRTKRVHFHYEWMHFLVKMYMCGFRRLRISEAKWSKVNTKTSTFYLVGWLGGWMETSLIKAKLHNEAQRAHQHAYPITFTYASHGNLILFLFIRNWYNVLENYLSIKRILQLVFETTLNSENKFDSTLSMMNVVILQS